MREFLSNFIGKKMDVVCTGGVAVRGEVVRIDGEILELRDDEEKVCYVSVDKITVVWEAKEKKERPGMVRGFSKNQS